MLKPLFFPLTKPFFYTAPKIKPVKIYVDMFNWKITINTYVENMVENVENLLKILWITKPDKI